MTDAPERIWAFDYDLENHDGTSVNVLVWDQNRPWPFKATEYIRADLSQAAVEAIEAKLAKVIAAYRLEAIRRRDYTHDAFDNHIAELTGGGDE